MREKVAFVLVIVKQRGLDTNDFVYNNLLGLFKILEALVVINKSAREKQKEEQEHQDLLRLKARDDPSLCICGERGTQKCTGCMTTLYCSKKCLRQDYKPHRDRCQELQNEKENAEN